jgi:hypothetical protein
MRMRGLSVLMRELAVFASSLGMMLRLFVLAERMVMIGLVVVMRGGVVVTGRGVVMLRRRMLCHLSALPFHSIDRIDVQRSDIGRITQEWGGTRYFCLVTGWVEIKSQTARSVKRSGRSRERATSTSLPG